MIDRKDFLARSVKKIDDRGLSATLQLLHAAVPMEKVTQSLEWNSYLELISGLLEEERNKYASFQTRISDPTLVNTDKIMILKIALAQSSAVIETLNYVSDIPKQIMEAAKRKEDKISSG